MLGQPDKLAKPDLTEKHKATKALEENIGWFLINSKETFSMGHFPQQGRKSMCSEEETNKSDDEKKILTGCCSVVECLPHMDRP